MATINGLSVSVASIHFYYLAATYLGSHIHYVVYTYIYMYLDTGSGSHLGAVWKSYKPLHMAEECCDVHPIHLTGE